jgi:hypothetical protein
MKRKSTPSPAYAYKAARHWSMRAEEMCALAEEASDPMVRAMMLGLAADYDLFAEIADDRAGGGSIVFRLAEMRLNAAQTPKQETHWSTIKGPSPKPAENKL